MSIIHSGSDQGPCDANLSRLRLGTDSSSTAAVSSLVAPRPALGDGIARLLLRQDHRAAAEALRAKGYGVLARDTLGVCLMRSGGNAEALRVYRQLVLTPGGTWTRTDIADRVKRNFATSLLLAGLPSGALEVLRETSDPLDRRVIELRVAVDDWASGLGWWQRFCWVVGSVEPRGTTARIDFVPGEIADEVFGIRLDTLPR